MEGINYAPVIIPTLNRYVHFKRCLESLERCTGAEFTEVYVGLDYPPSEKYVDGWNKIDQYLIEKEKENSFKKLHVIRREKNCGVGHPGSNGNVLSQYVQEKYNSYIFTEDDNEFSPNFLEYINNGLRLFKSNPRVIAISGYCYLYKIDGVDKNAYPGYNFSAWGVGRWRDKTPEYMKVGANEYLDNVLNSWRKSWRVYRGNPAWFNGLMEMKFKNTIYGDTMWCADCLLYDKVSIYPKVSKVRNYGNDGTGVHCKKIISQVAEQEIDENIHFEYDEGIDQLPAVNFLPYLKPKLYKWAGALLRYLFYRATHKDLFKLLKK